MKVLFILKYREVNDPEQGVYSHSGLSSGLFNSARMVAEMLNNLGAASKPCEAKLVQVVDNNDIDREVFAFKPDVVIIEAFWVVPEKFEVLKKLHPNVKWIIRNHSNIPFLAQEGMAMRWSAAYAAQQNVYLATNTKQSLHDLRDIVAESNDIDFADASAKVLYFPNFYIADVSDSWEFYHSRYIDIGCFGAIRPLKNHLTQAIAAIRLARELKRRLRFHINVGRQESGGSPVLNNLRGLFENNIGSELVEHHWMPHSDFVRVISDMDLSVQVSFSETFNIVTADAVTMGVPVVVGPDVSWIDPAFQADPTNSHDIVAKMKVAIEASKTGYHHVNRAGLSRYNARSYSAIGETLWYAVNHVDTPPHKHYY
jgi:hypothetical protein